MVFSNSIFLFLFLPAVLAVYYLLRTRRQRNLFLMFASLVFYAWGEPWFVFVMLLSILVNWLGGLALDRRRSEPGRKKSMLVLLLVFNLGLLGVFKYLMFLMNSVNWAFGLNFPVPKIALPIGISFFTFQAISYIMDVYRGKAQVQKDFFNVCLYISLFPQLIAGPIVRYQTVADEIETRTENSSDFAEGCRRFLVGLCKKVLLANNLALLADSAFALPSGEITVSAAWLMAIAYLWQVYFDFSGYSDMAIGLGRMFGFHFLENFEFPMVCKTISEFWKRWHISLGSWFQDYLYFPLGGSRVKSKARLIFNMFMVWSLTGLWHGADWTYFVWGCGFWVFLVLERFFYGKWMQEHFIGHIYALAAVTTITVIIRSPSVPFALTVIRSMYGFAPGGIWNATSGMYLREYGWFVLAALVFSLPVGPAVQKLLHIPDKPMQVLRAVGIVCAFALSLTYVIMGGYNPFIYFNF